MVIRRSENLGQAVFEAERSGTTDRANFRGEGALVCVTAVDDGTNRA